MNLKRGDIVFNHLQTKELLNKGKTGSRAKIVGGEGAFAHGTAHANSAGIKIKFNGSKTTRHKKKKTTSSSGKSKTGSRSSRSGKSGSRRHKKKTKSKSKKSALQKLLDNVGKAFDFVEVRIERTAAATDLWIAKAENVKSLTSALGDYDKALSSVGSSITANTKGKKKYESYYKSFAKKAIKAAPSSGKTRAAKKKSKTKNKKALKSYFEKVRNGSISIKTISNDKIRSAVEEYKNWYDKAQQCKQQIEELKKQQQELVQTKLEKILSYYDAFISKTNALNEGLQKANELNIALGTDTSTSKTQSLNDQISKYYSQRSYQQSELNKYLSAYNSAKKKGILTDEQKATYEAEIETLRNNIEDTNISIANARQEIDQIELDKLAKLTDAAEKAASALSHAATMAENHGDYATKETYTSQITANLNTIDSYHNEMNEIEAEMKKYKADSEKYKELLSQWHDKNSAVQQLQETNETLRQNAIQVPFDESNRVIDKRNTRIDENNDLMNLLNQDNLNDPETGKITSDGLAKIALLSDNIKQQQFNVADLEEQKKALLDLYDSGQLGASTFEEKMTELNKQIREAATNTNDYKNQILELGKTTMQSEVDALLKVIDKRKEALSRKKEYYDYDKTIKSQTKDLQALEAQRAALEGVEGDAAKAQRAKLDAQIADAKEQMDDTRKEHQYSIESQGYDDLTEKLQDTLDKQLKELSSSLEAQTKLIEKFLGQVGDSFSEVYKKITDTATNSGISSGMSNEFNSEYNNTSNGKSAEENAKENQKMNESVTSNVANSNTSVTGTTGIIGNKVDSSKVSVGNASQTANRTPPSPTNRSIISFKLNTGNFKLACGESKGVKVQDVIPPDAVGQKYTWKSSDASIATVGSSRSSVTVVANKKYKTGSVTITCTSTNGVQASVTATIYLNTSQKAAKKYGITMRTGKAYTTAEIKKVSQLNQYLAKKGFNMLSNPKGIEAVGKKLGLITSKNSKKGKEFYKGKDGKYSAKQKNKILAKLKKAGLRDGGVIDGVVPISKLNSVVQGNHDHGIATVRRDEILLKPETSDVLKQAVKISESVVKNSKTSDIMTGTGDFSSYYDALIKVESGGMIDKSVLNDLKVVAKQVYDQEQANKLKEYHKIGRKPTIGK